MLGTQSDINLAGAMTISIPPTEKTLARLDKYMISYDIDEI